MHTLLSKLIGYRDKEILTSTWKTKKAPGISVGTATGIGVYCQVHGNNSTATIMI
jgi:hypothetical protein